MPRRECSLERTPGRRLTAHGWRRAVAAALGVLLALALVGAQAHRSLALHAFCSEHGELVHVDHLADHSGEDFERSEAREKIPVHGEHGCACLALLASSFVASRPVPMAAALASATRFEPGAPHAVAARPIPLLRQAPKSSPPRA